MTEIKYILLNRTLNYSKRLKFLYRACVGKSIKENSDDMHCYYAHYNYQDIYDHYLLKETIIIHLLAAYEIVDVNK